MIGQKFKRSRQLQEEEKAMQGQLSQSLDDFAKPSAKLAWLASISDCSWQSRVRSAKTWQPSQPPAAPGCCHHAPLDRQVSHM